MGKAELLRLQNPVARYLIEDNYTDSSISGKKESGGRDNQLKTYHKSGAKIIDLVDFLLWNG